MLLILDQIGMLNTILISIAISVGVIWCDIEATIPGKKIAKEDEVCVLMMMHKLMCASSTMTKMDCHRMIP